jgi:hypothetical protein
VLKNVIISREVGDVDRVWTDGYGCSHIHIVIVAIAQTELAINAIVWQKNLRSKPFLISIDRFRPDTHQLPVNYIDITNMLLSLEIHLNLLNVFAIEFLLIH